MGSRGLGFVGSMGLDGVALVASAWGNGGRLRGQWELGGTCMCQENGLLPNDTTVSFLPYMEHIIKVLSKNNPVDETFGYYENVFACHCSLHTLVGPLSFRILFGLP